MGFQKHTSELWKIICKGLWVTRLLIWSEAFFFDNSRGISFVNPVSINCDFTGMLGLHSHLFLIRWVCPSLAAHLDRKLQCEQSIPRLEEAIGETLLSGNVKNVEILHRCESYSRSITTNHPEIYLIKISAAQIWNN